MSTKVILILMLLLVINEDFVHSFLSSTTKSPLRSTIRDRQVTSLNRYMAKKAQTNEESALSEKSLQKRKTKKTEEEVIHWLNETDPVIIGKDKDGSHQHLCFTVRGNPLPLRRHRSSRGFMYNPSANSQASFRDVVIGQLFEKKADPDSIEPVFGTLPLYISIVFRLKRPKNHFRSSKPGEGRLRDAAPDRLSLTRMDVDNLAKFVLDSMNGILYEDDKQIMSLHVTKVFDDEGECRGSTQVLVQQVDEHLLEQLLLPTSIKPV